MASYWTKLAPGFDSAFNVMIDCALECMGCLEQVHHDSPSLGNIHFERNLNSDSKGVKLQPNEATLWA